jgi:hypothetical protein
MAGAGEIGVAPDPGDPASHVEAGMVIAASGVVRREMSPDGTDSSRLRRRLPLEVGAPRPSVSGDLHDHPAADLRQATTTIRDAAELLHRLWWLAMTTEDHALSERLAGASHALHHAARLLDRDPRIG